MKRIASLILILLLLSPTVANCGWKEKAALWAYFDALAKGSVKQLDALLSPNFEYHFYKDNKLNKLNRSDELKSIERLIKDLPTNSLDLPALFAEDDKDWTMFYFKLVVIFEDSPKVYTDSFFRGALLNINEAVTVVIDDDGKISRIVELKDEKRKNKLSFGYLKAIHLKKQEYKCRDANGPVKDGDAVHDDLVCELYDHNSRELLLTCIQKIGDPLKDGITTNYYWPDKQRIENFE